MTSGVSRSRSLPGSAKAGEAKTSAIKAMQTLRTQSDEPWTCIGMVRIQSPVIREGTRKIGKSCTPSFGTGRCNGAQGRN